MSGMRPCFRVVFGDESIDPTPGEHVWQQQPFHNEDSRAWCSRCGALVDVEQVAA